jgi:hypothetical protein
MVARPDGAPRRLAVAPAAAKEWQGKPDKFEKFFDPKPGSGS